MRSAAIEQLSSARPKNPAVAQARQYPSLDQEHRGLDLGLVARMPRACGEQRAAVVLGKFLVGSIGFGVVAVWILDQRAGLVGHNQARRATEEFERAHLGADPVSRGLARSGAGVGVVRCAERGHEDLGRGDRAGGRVNQRHGVAAVVHEELLAGDVDLAHRALQALRERAVLDAKARVLVRQRVVAGVLLPQQLQRDAGALELLVNEREVGDELVARSRHRRAEQPGLEFVVVECLGHAPVDAGRAGQRHVLARRALGDLQRAATSP